MQRSSQILSISEGKKIMKKTLLSLAQHSWHYSELNGNKYFLLLTINNLSSDRKSTLDNYIYFDFFKKSFIKTTNLNKKNQLRLRNKSSKKTINC